MKTWWRLGVGVVIASTAATLPVLPSGHVGADDDSEGVIAGEYVIELKPEGDIDRIASSWSALAPPEPLGDGSPVYRLLLDPTADVGTVVSALLNTDGVAFAQPNMVQGSVGGLGLRKVFFGDVGPAAVTPSSTGYGAAQPGVAWPLPASDAGAGSTVAVLDTGVDAAHPVLAGRVLPGIDVVDDDTDAGEVANAIDDNGDGTIDEAYGHGTYVAGLVATVAPGASVLPIRVLDSDGSGSAWHLMQGIAFAGAAGADVVNMSLGGPTGGIVFERLVDRIADAGVILVAAAGNSAVTSETYPAAFDPVVAVSSIDARTGAAASFANSGSWVDIAAPGVEITSVFPGARYAAWGGTSASAPLVAGLLAVVQDNFAGLPTSDAIAAITGTASADRAPGLTAYGTVDPAAALLRRP